MTPPPTISYLTAENLETALNALLEEYAEPAEEYNKQLSDLAQMLGQQNARISDLEHKLAAMTELASDYMNRYTAEVQRRIKWQRKAEYLERKKQ